MKKRRTIYLYLIIMIVLMAANVLTAVYSSSRGVELAALETELTNLEKENRDLSTKFVSMSSLTNTNQMAEKLNLTTAEKIIYLTTSTLVASANGN